MLRAAGFFLKFTLFSVGILMLGNWAQWDGKTLSEHVKVGVKRAERSSMFEQVRHITRKLTDEARSGFGEKSKARMHGVSKRVLAAVTPIQNSDAAEEGSPDISDRTVTGAAAPLHAAASAEKIGATERQKLRALIRELNSSTSKD